MTQIYLLEAANFFFHRNYVGLSLDLLRFGTSWADEIKRTHHTSNNNISISMVRTGYKNDTLNRCKCLVMTATSASISSVQSKKCSRNFYYNDALSATFGSHRTVAIAAKHDSWLANCAAMTPSMLRSRPGYGRFHWLSGNTFQNRAKAALHI
jgi:hypothetical protein